MKPPDVLRDTARFPLTHPRTTFYTVLLLAVAAWTLAAASLVLLLSITLIQAALATSTIIRGSDNAGPTDQSDSGGS